VEVPTFFPALKLPFSNRSTVRSRWAPPGANGAITVNSETDPKRMPIRPALSVCVSCASTASDFSVGSAFSSATLAISGASRYTSRSC
jgi:hypothetical protein